MVLLTLLPPVLLLELAAPLLPPPPLPPRAFLKVHISEEMAPRRPLCFFDLRREGEDVKCQCCQMAKFDPFLSLDCARVEGLLGGTGWRAWGRNPRKGRDQILLHSVAEP